MTDIAPRDLQHAGERAAHYRRRLAIVNGAPSVAALMEQITFVPTRERQTRDPDWWIIGAVVDLVADGELLVYFNPATKAVKVQRPTEPDAAAHPPQTSAFPRALTKGGVVASQAYRYFYGEKEYAPEEAGELVKQQGTRGWRWEPK